jgi:hypothetical protein
MNNHIPGATKMVPVAGEVGEMVADLRTMATDAGLACQPGDFKILTLAANMLQWLGERVPAGDEPAPEAGVLVERVWNDALAGARAALATPPPEPPTDTEILEFLLKRFRMYSPEMNGQHSWRFINDYFMGKAVGQSAKDAVIACMREQTKGISELEAL